MLNEIKKQQKQGTYKPCPRCGQYLMNNNLYRNALSRYADIYICDSCGSDEAFNDFLDRPPLPLADWACFKKPRD